MSSASEEKSEASAMEVCMRAGHPAIVADSGEASAFSVLPTPSAPYSRHCPSPRALTQPHARPHTNTPTLPAPRPAPHTPVAQVVVEDEKFSPELLRQYYARLFPYKQMFEWLSYGHDPKSESKLVKKDFFLKREFSFTIENDIYIRYLSFRDREEMQKQIMQKQPHKIDIGAVYSFPPKEVRHAAHTGNTCGQCLQGARHGGEGVWRVAYGSRRVAYGVWRRVPTGMNLLA